MKNLRIGTKIFVSFGLVLLLLLGIALTSIISTMRTSSNIERVDKYSGLQNSANELLHILNETRISAGVFYATHTPESFEAISKQLMYCDLRLEKLYTYLDENQEVAIYRSDIEEFDTLYSQWCTKVGQMGVGYPLDGTFTQTQSSFFEELAGEAKRLNLLCHEKLSNTVTLIGEQMDATMVATKDLSVQGLYVVIMVSALALIAALVLAVLLWRSITIPLASMRNVLTQIGQTGDLQVQQETQETLEKVAAGGDETAQCVQALQVLLKRLHLIDDSLALVAEGDLTAEVQLQSPQDTIGLAVQRMVGDLSGKFTTIAASISQVHQLANELDQGSQLLASGSNSQAEAVSNLAASVAGIEDKTQKSVALTQQAGQLVNSIQENAQTGTQKMQQMTVAAADINEASQSIGKVIQTIDSIAFQTNILALNAAVEAARAGQHGKGFAVVADEVRNLANKSAEAARETGALIEDTIQKAALGSTIAEMTSEALGKIVEGVQKSSEIIQDISTLSQQQKEEVQRITTNVSQVEEIVRQNNQISAQSASASAEITGQSNKLRDLVAQFQLRGQGPFENR